MTTIFKKTFGMLMISLSMATLSACGDENGEVQNNLSLYDGPGFTISVNPNWQVIPSSEFHEEIPKETVVAFTAPEAFNGFFTNVNVIRENLNQPVNPLDYGQANINLANQTLTDYQKVQEAVVDLGDTGQQGLVHIFQARLNPSEKLIRFAQLYTTSNSTGYIVSGGMLPDTPDDIRNQVGAMVTSFRVK